MQSKGSDLDMKHGLDRLRARHAVWSRSIQSLPKIVPRRAGVALSPTSTLFFPDVVLILAPAMSFVTRVT